jgi:hypothetical protein
MNIKEEAKPVDKEVALAVCGAVLGIAGLLLVFIGFLNGQNLTVSRMKIDAPGAGVYHTDPVGWPALRHAALPSCRRVNLAVNPTAIQSQVAINTGLKVSSLPSWFDADGRTVRLVPKARSSKRMAILEFVLLEPFVRQ